MSFKERTLGVLQTVASPFIKGGKATIDYLMDKRQHRPICYTEWYPSGTRQEIYTDYERILYNTGDIIHRNHKGEVIMIKTHDGYVWPAKPNTPQEKRLPSERIKEISSREMEAKVVPEVSTEEPAKEAIIAAPLPVEVSTVEIEPVKEEVVSE